MYARSRAVYAPQLRTALRVHSAAHFGIAQTIEMASLLWGGRFVIVPCCYSSLFFVSLRFAYLCLCASILSLLRKAA